MNKLAIRNSTRILHEIVDTFPFILKEEIKKASHTKLAKLSKQTGNDLFSNFYRAKQLEEMERKRKRKSRERRKFY